MIRVKRKREYFDMFRAYRVFVDGELVGAISWGKSIDLELARGPHQIELQLDWVKSNALDFVDEGKLIEFECGSNLQGMKFIFMPLRLLNIGHWMYLKRCEKES